MSLMVSVGAFEGLIQIGLNILTNRRTTWAVPNITL